MWSLWKWNKENPLWEYEHNLKNKIYWNDLEEDSDEELEEHSMNSVRVGKSQLVEITSEIEVEEE